METPGFRVRTVNEMVSRPWGRHPRGSKIGFKCETFFENLTKVQDKISVSAFLDFLLEFGTFARSQ